MKRLRKKQSTGKTGAVKAEAMGLGIGTATALILTGLAGQLIVGGTLPQSAGGMLPALIWAASSVTASLIAAKRAGEWKWLAGALCGALMLLMAFALHALVITEEFTRVLPVTLGAVAGSLVGATLGARNGKRRSYR